jgi:hypothetical protein
VYILLYVRPNFNYLTIFIYFISLFSFFIFLRLVRNHKRVVLLLYVSARRVYVYIYTTYSAIIIYNARLLYPYTYIIIYIINNIEQRSSGFERTYTCVLVSAISSARPCCIRIYRKYCCRPCLCTTRDWVPPAAWKLIPTRNPKHPRIP